MSDPLQDLYTNIQNLEPYFSKYITSDPIVIGRLAVARPHGPLEGILVQTGSPGADGIPETIVNGRYITIVVENDRSRPDAAEYDFQVEITEISNGDHVIFSKQQPSDNWPCKLAWSANSVLYNYDIREGTLVRGSVLASTISGPNRPSQQLMKSNFKVRLVRDPQCMAVGAFEIPVLPVVLRYAPPQTQEPPHSNTLKYTVESGTATTVKFSLKNEESTTTPTEGLSGVNLKDTLALVKTGAKAGALLGAGGFTGLIGTVADLVDSCLSSITWDTTIGSSQSDEGSFNATNSQKVDVSIGTDGKEAGLGDQIFILRNVRFAWVSDDLEKVKLMPLGPAPMADRYSIDDLLHDASILFAQQPQPQPQPQPTPVASGDNEFGVEQGGAHSSPTLHQGLMDMSLLDSAHRVIGVMEHAGRSPGRFGGSLEDVGQLRTKGLDLECIQALLGLDPLVQSGATTDLSRNPRFRRVALEIGGFIPAWEVSVEYGYSDVLTLKLEDSTGAMNVKFNTEVQQKHASLLDKLFSSPTGEETLKHTTTISTTHQDDAYTVRQAQVVLQPAHGLYVQCYYDTVFDSYVFQLVSPAPGEYSADGTATDDSGSPLPYAWVHLSFGRRSVLVKTDAQGRYALPTSSPNSVLATLRINNQDRRIRITPRRVQA